MTQTRLRNAWLETFFILLALILAFGTYETLGVALHTDTPVVSVTSNSMIHQPFPGTCIDETTYTDGFDQYWQSCGEPYRDTYGITKEEFQQFPFADGFSRGDILIVKGTTYQNIQIGDVVVYDVADRSIPIVHRVVAKHNNTLETKGDSNTGQNPYESNVEPGQVKGVAVATIPWVGYVKVIPYDVYACLTGQAPTSHVLC